MSDLTALERRKFAAVAAKFNAQYLEAEKNQELTLDFRKELAWELEKEHRLPKNSLLAYIAFEEQSPESLLQPPPLAERMARKRNHEKIGEPEVEILAPAAPEANRDIADIDLLRKMAALESDKEYADFRAEELLEAAKEAARLFKDQQDTVTKKLSLFTMSGRVSDAGYFQFVQRTIHKAAEKVLNNPEDVSLSLKPLGGKKSAVNNDLGEAFVLKLKLQMEKLDPVAQNALKGNALEAWIVRRHREFFTPNSRAPAEPLSKNVIAKLKSELNLVKTTVKYVAARRLEAMGDPRNYMTWMIASILGMKNVPLELRFNYDDSSLMFGDHNEVAGVAYCTASVLKLLKSLNRSVGTQRADLGPDGLAACLVVLGFLASALGLLHNCIVKVYDRAIKSSDNLRLDFIETVDACDVYCLYIRGKQMACGVVADDDESRMSDAAHGGVPELKSSDHASECEVAELVFNRILGPKIADLKARYFVKKNHREQNGFTKMNDVELAVGTSAYLQSKKSEYETKVANAGPAVNANDNEEDEEREDPAEAIDVEDSDDVHSVLSDDDDDADCDTEICPFLPQSITTFRGHQHRSLNKCCDMKQSHLYTCSVCSYVGTGVAYVCSECNWAAHPRCVMPEDAKGLDHLLPRSEMSIMAHLDQNFEERAVLVVDGCTGQIRALVGKDDKLGSIQTVLNPLGIDILKGPAQLSPCSNALDCARCFSMLKGRKPNWTMKNSCASPTMANWIIKSLYKVLSAVSRGRRNAFELVFRHIESAISEVFTIRRIRRGWEKSGLLDLNYHTIMSHWLPWAQQSPAQILGIESLFPAFFFEMGMIGALSDATMHAMQPYFAVDFKMFLTDRCLLTVSRQRGMLVTVWLRVREFVDRATRISIEDMHNPPDPLPLDPKINAKGAKSSHGKAICRCKGLYVNDEDGWKEHKTTEKHKKCVETEQLAIAPTDERAVFRHASELDYMQQAETVTLKAVCQSMQASHVVGKKLIANGITDADLVWLQITPDRILMAFFGLHAGQAHLLRDACRNSRGEMQPRALQFDDAPPTAPRAQQPQKQ